MEPHGGEFRAECVADSVDGRFGYGVDGLGWVGFVSCEGGYIDDGGIFDVFHHRDEESGELQGSGEIGLEKAGGFVEVGFEEGLGSNGGGIIDQDVDFL